MPSDGNFNINGIVNPDRNPHPSMIEIKYSQQNVGFDHKNGILKIKNRFYFTGLNDYEIICSFLSNEKVLNELNLSNSNCELASLKPQESIEIDLTSHLNSLKPKICIEYFLNLKVLAKTNNQRFIQNGYEIAHDQFRLPIEPLPKTEKKETGPELTITNTEETITIASNKVNFLFDKKEGFVKSYKID